MTSCPKEAPELNWDGEIYTGDADSGTIFRMIGRDSQGRPILKRISTTDPAFNGFRCMSADDEAELIEAENARLLKCEKWSEQ